MRRQQIPLRAFSNRPKHPGRIAAVVCILIVVGGRAYGDLQTLDYPGASYTSAQGIAGDSIVGYYRTDEVHYHGFLFDGITWTPLNYPGATSTLAYGISGNDVVGAYSAGGHLYGFLYDGTAYSPLSLEAPASVDIRYNTTAYLSNTVYRTLTYPDHTTLTGISADRIIGIYNDNAAIEPAWHSFVYDADHFVILNAPEPVGMRAWGIDGNNIVGMCDRSYYPEFTYGFLYNGTTYKYLGYGGAAWTSVYGISGDAVVGSYFDGESMHGFRAEVSDFSDVVPTPLPGAALLGCIGLSHAAWRLRRGSRSDP